MKELKDAVAAAFDRVVASGAIEQAIEKKLADTINSALDEHLRSYSDFGKAIKEKVQQSIGVNVERMDLPSYGDLVTKIIRRRVDESMQGKFAAQLEKDIAELLAPAPAEITLEALVDEFIKKYAEDDGSNAGDDFTLLIERDGSFTYVCLDKAARKGQYSCDFRIGIHKDEVFSLQFGGQDVKNKMFVGPLYGFERTLFQLYTARSKLIVPADASEHDYPTSFPYRD